MKAFAPRPRRWRVLVVVGLTLAIAGSHWVTPTHADSLNLPHIVLRKMFLLPVVLGALWFDLRGSLLAAVAVTFLYMPHIVFQWSGQTAENLNQIGEIGSLWLVALLAGSLFRNERRARSLVEAAHRGVLAALVAALDAREEQTEQHSLRVAAYAGRLGRELALDRGTLDRLELAATLHDIGKIGIPDEILLKKGPLDEEEWEAIRQHPAIGRRILDKVPAYSEIAEIVYSHHERWDGKGYPRGLAGGKIPVAARIFAVVDAYDALTKDRPYHGGEDHETALAQIRNGSATQFDAEVVEAFLRIPLDELKRLSDGASIAHAEG